MTMPHKTIDTELDPRWAAVVARSAEADGSFLLLGPDHRRVLPALVRLRGGRGRRTSGSTPTREDAERAGFRPCKRCKPDQPSLAEQHAGDGHRSLPAASRPRRAMPTLEELAATRGHEHLPLPSRVQGDHRPHAERRTPPPIAASGCADELGRARSVTAAIYESGYNSNGRFYGESAGCSA